MVGLGPGSDDYISPGALRALSTCNVVAGYKTYIKLIKHLLKEQEIISTGMTKEIDRCRLAVARALAGDHVAMVSSGDPGVYGMAGLVLEIAHQEGLLGKIGIEIIPGITSASIAAAKLGAPLMHDFAVISLSDLLTPWHVIEKRLELAARGDFVTVLYNPASMKRRDQIVRARDIMLAHRNPETPVGLVRNAEREDEEVVLTDIYNMLKHNIDMLTTVVVGNSNTRRLGDFLVTPRGYRL